MDGRRFDNNLQQLVILQQLLRHVLSDIKLFPWQTLIIFSTDCVANVSVNYSQKKLFCFPPLIPVRKLSVSGNEWVCTC